MSIKRDNPMKILYGNDLVNNLRYLAENVKNRLWIATPFLGSWTAVRKILSLKWFNTATVQTRILLDISNKNGIDYESFSFFQKRATIKTLAGLHAKIFLIDNTAIITSANLTNTAFSKRYEVGILIEDISSLQSIYEKWWNELAEKVPSNWIPEKIVSIKKENEETYGKSLIHLWDLPSDPGDPTEKLASRFLDYEYFLEIYNDFTNIYKSIQRVWLKSPLYFEIDSFFNYLFHEHPNTPSKIYNERDPRKLNSIQRYKEIKKYALLYRKWVKAGNESKWREKHSKIVRNLLKINRIDKIKKNDIIKVISQLNSMNSVDIARHKFLNPKNNNIQDIREAWKELLFGEVPIITRMTNCNEKLYSFGKSSIQELIGFYYLDKYPIRNTNVNSGLRFFGYDVAVY